MNSREQYTMAYGLKASSYDPSREPLFYQHGTFDSCNQYVHLANKWMRTPILGHHSFTSGTPQLCHFRISLYKGKEHGVHSFHGNTLNKFCIYHIHRILALIDLQRTSFFSSNVNAISLWTWQRLINFSKFGSVHKSSFLFPQSNVQFNTDLFLPHSRNLIIKIQTWKTNHHVIVSVMLHRTNHIPF